MSFEAADLRIGVLKIFAALQESQSQIAWEYAAKWQASRYDKQARHNRRHRAKHRETINLKQRLKWASSPEFREACNERRRQRKADRATHAV